VGGEGFFQCISVYDARMDFEQKSNDLGCFIAEVVRFKKDSLCVEPIDEGGIIDGVVLDL